MRKMLMLAPLTAALALGFTTAAQATEAGDWLFSVGGHVVDPDSNNGTLAGGALSTDVGSSFRPTVTAEYFVAPNWGVELLASAPFKHNIRLNGADAGSTQHLPPTLGLQYHFAGEKVSPFIGAGVNYTIFFNEKTKGPLAGTDLSLKNSFGLAAHAGLDFAIAEGKWLRVDARWIDIDADVKVNGAKVGTAKIDPLIYGAAFVWSF